MDTAKAISRANRIASTLFPGQSLSVNDCAGSAFGHVQKAPPDAIFLTKQNYLADKDPRKVNLGIGAYRTDEGKPFVLNCVREAEKILLAKGQNKEYLGQAGLGDFTDAAQRLVFGANHPILKSGRIATVQSLSGTGALRLAIDFIQKFLENPVLMYPAPTWGNHKAIAQEARVKTGAYRYWDKNTRGLDYNGMVEDIANAPRGAVVCLHACAHNPTGVDPTPEQWQGIAQAVRKSGAFVLFDSAYQGFASGDLDRDAHALRLFVDQGIPFMLCQSFAKNMGLYGERIGALHFVLPSAEEATACKSQVAILVRRSFSNPPLHGARIVSTVLNDDRLRTMWYNELKGMADRIISMRHALLNGLKKLNTPGDWTHVVSQIGMFSFTGLSPTQVEHIINKHHIYLLKSGRISMAGVTSSNVNYIAAAIDDAVRNVR